MGEMPMGGAGVMSFLGMWMVMMVPMMLPALVPVLWRSRLGATHAVVVSAGYYLVWAVVGVAAYPVAVVVMPHLDAGVVVVIAGAYQLPPGALPARAIGIRRARRVEAGCTSRRALQPCDTRVHRHSSDTRTHGCARDGAAGRSHRHGAGERAREDTGEIPCALRG